MYLVQIRVIRYCILQQRRAFVSPADADVFNVLSSHEAMQSFANRVLHYANVTNNVEVLAKDSEIIDDMTLLAEVLSTVEALQELVNCSCIRDDNAWMETFTDLLEDEGNVTVAL